MFRAIIKDRKNLDGPQIADIPVLSGSVSEDKEQKATSSFVVADFPEAVKNGDIIGVYDSTGRFYYWGIITSRGEDNRDELQMGRTRVIKCNQFESFFDDELLIHAPANDNQKRVYKEKTVSDVLDYYFTCKKWGYVTTANTSNAVCSPQFNGFIDKDIIEDFKGIRYEIIDDGLDQNGEAEHIKFPLEKEAVNLEDLLYDVYDKHRRIIRPYFNRPILPDEYQPVLYIESDGNGQYIDTNIVPKLYNKTLRIELDAQFTDITRSANQYLISSAYYNETQDSRRQIFVALSGTDHTFRMLNGTYQSTWISVGHGDTDRHLFTIDQIRRSYILFNNTNFSDIAMTNVSKSIVLFAYRTAASSGEPITIYSPGRIYGLKLYGNGSLIMNLVPCYRKSDLEIGMYDLCTNTFFTNAGTGSFTRSEKIYDRCINIAIFKPNGVVTYNQQHTWDYSEKVLFDSWESIKNVNIVDEDVETNTLMIFSDDGATNRGAFTILTDGTIQQMTSDTSVANRYGTGKTAFVFDSSNAIKDIAQSNLPASQFNHKITFNIMFNGEYKFTDFNLGQIIKFYSKSKPGKTYESALTAWSYDIAENSDVIGYAQFTLGNVRNNLTSKINLNVKKKKKK